MRASTLVGDTASRRVSPAFFVCALVCFFFTFAGVSCDTQKAQSAVAGLANLGGSGSTVSTQQLSACLGALNGVDLVTYSGIDLAFGRAPATLAQPPAACAASAVSPNSGSTSASTVATGVQPLALGAFIVVLLGIVGTIIGLFVRIAARLRLATTMLLGGLGFFLLLFDQFHVHTVIVNTLNNEAAGSGAPFSIADYFDVNDGTAWIIALVALGAAALYGFAALMSSYGPVPVPLEAPAAAAPPPGAPP